jgi:phospholipid-translocating ATPase
MSVIVRNLQTKELVLFCKGAETAIFDKCQEKSNNYRELHAIKFFANQGLRTMCVAYKLLSEQQYARIDSMLNEAYNDIVRREEKLDKLNDLIESDLVMIGATAAEDKLQADVPEVLEDLRRAGIKIWVLTGDKVETGIYFFKILLFIYS